MRVLMISGDNQVIRGIDGPFALTLRELSATWDEIDVLCPGVIGERVFNDKVKLKGIRKFFMLLDLFPFMMKKKYDLIVSHDYGLMLNGVNAFVMSKVLNIPHISEIHHIEGFPEAVSWKENFYAVLGKVYVMTIGRSCRGIRIDNLGDIFPLLQKLGIKKHNVIYLPPIYLELDKYRPLIQPKKVDVLFIGRLAANKGIFTILIAIKKLREQGMDVKTKIKGRGPLQKKIQQYIVQNSLQDLVEMDDRILNEEKLIELYNETKVLVCASTVEGGPRVTLEAMACCVPVITTPCGIMPEVIQNGVNGFIFDGSVEQLSSMIKKVLMEPELLKSFSERSRESVKPYDFNKTLKNYALRYKSIVEAQ